MQLTLFQINEMVIPYKARFRNYLNMDGYRESRNLASSSHLHCCTRELLEVISALWASVSSFKLSISFKFFKFFLCFDVNIYIFKYFLSTGISILFKFDNHKSCLKAYRKQNATQSCSFYIYEKHTNYYQCKKHPLSVNLFSVSKFI